MNQRLSLLQALERKAEQAFVSARSNNASPFECKAAFEAWQAATWEVMREKYGIQMTWAEAQEEMK